MPYLRINFLLVLVSSQSIIFENASIDNARIEMSAKLPIGVATTYKPEIKFFLLN